MIGNQYMQIFNSQTRQKEEFIPIRENQVTMYVCGPTVYDQIHIGNARTFLSFDIIRRYLIHKGYDVTFAQNITDVDDKIIKRANERGVDSAEVAEECAEAFIEQMHRFNILDPDIRPRATHEIGAMIEMISGLIEKGHAYESGGDVYFKVRSYPAYGEVSGRNIDDLMVGARVEANDLKSDPLDFVLWKAAKPGEPAWESPWGLGRPGWHTECSAMVHKYLGTPIDIHGGGSDLSFPHHENESAQACSCWEHKLAHYWMHTGMLLVDGEKMSKSLGNFYTLKEVLDQYSADALRLLMIQTHYRSALDFSFERLKGAESSLERIKTALRNGRWALDHLSDRIEEFKDDPDEATKLQEEIHGESISVGLSQEAIILNAAVNDAISSFESEMDDDFNSAGALGGLYSLVAALNAYLEAPQAKIDDAVIIKKALDTLVELMGVFGINLQDDQEAQTLHPEIIDLASELAGYVGDDVELAADALMTTRALAREQKDWARADEIRDRLGELGFKIEDTAQGARVILKDVE